MVPPIHADPLKELRKHLPKTVHGWKAVSEDRLFNDKTIFDYINGAAEVYRAYNMKQCLSRRYSIPDKPDIVLDLFDMRSPQDAFGVFTHDTEGKSVPIGQDARYRPGWLSFWKSRFFISIYMQEETPEAEKAVLELGRNIAALIDKTGEAPEILSFLPKTGLQTESIRYLHHPIVLNYHFYIADENLLNLSPDMEAALADYRVNEENILLLLAKYPDDRIAKESYRNFIADYLPDADDTGAARLEDGKWSAVVQKGDLLAIVLEADTKETARRLLASIRNER